MLLIKHRARKALENCKVSGIGCHLEGVGGIVGKPVFSIHLGDHRLHMTAVEWEDLRRQIEAQSFAYRTYTKDR